MHVTDPAWAPSDWRGYPVRQQPAWPSPAAADAVLQELRAMPPLVFAGEARDLEAALGDVAQRRAFLLQAGDCAESFRDFSAVSIREKLKIFLQMSVVMIYGSGLPLVKVGRIAGQFAKPRSEPTERVGELELPSFFGHIVNDDAPTAAARTPDPSRLLRAYHQSAATLNLVRAFTNGGFADLTQVHTWNQEFVANAPEGQRYEALAAEIERALDFVRACGIDLAQAQRLHRVDLWTSHEGLVLDYEEALTRRDSLTGDWYDCSAHMLWIGERTRQPGGCARGVLRPRAQSARGQARALGDGGRGARALRGAQSGAAAGAADADRADGRGAPRRRVAADRARRPGLGPPGCLGDGSHARQRVPDAVGRQDPELRGDHGRGRSLLLRLSE